MSRNTNNKENTEIYDKSISRLASANVIKDSALSEELLKKYKNIVKSTLI